MSNLHPDLKAVLYRAKYRSSKEADAILGGFALTWGSSLTHTEVRALADLLQHDDPEIFSWLDAPENAPSHICQNILSRIKTFAHGVHSPDML